MLETSERRKLRSLVFVLLLTSTHVPMEGHLSEHDIGES